MENQSELLSQESENLEQGKMSEIIYLVPFSIYTKGSFNISSLLSPAHTAPAGETELNITEEINAILISG